MNANRANLDAANFQSLQQQKASSPLNIKVIEKTNQTLIKPPGWYSITLPHGMTLDSSKNKLQLNCPYQLSLLPGQY